MEQLFDLLIFFGTPFGLGVIGAAAAAIILFWDWRLAVAGLFVAQLGVSTVSVRVEQVPAQWAGVMTIVTGLACLILALSAQQARTPPSARQAGTWILRALALVLVYVAWRALSNEVRIPELVPEVTSLFVWLAICALVMLGLSDNPLFTAVALLLWCVPVQAVVGVLLGAPTIIALIGILELGLALACSYLVLAEQLPVVERPPVLTDITFPEHFPTYAPPGESPQARESLRETALGWWRGLTGGPAQRPGRRPSTVHPARPMPEQSQGSALLVRKQQ
jgi:hypothetical protein